MCCCQRDRSLRRGVAWLDLNGASGVGLFSFWSILCLALVMLSTLSNLLPSLSSDAPQHTDKDKDKAAATETAMGDSAARASIDRPAKERPSGFRIQNEARTVVSAANTDANRCSRRSSSCGRRRRRATTR